MRAEHYIAELLYRYNCVVIPDFGAFLTNTKATQINEKQHTIYPPTKSILFNQQLTESDGLLVSHMAHSKKMPFEEVLNEVQELSKEWINQLRHNQSLYLEGIGKLWMDDEQNIQFLPEITKNYLISSFGFSPLNATPVTRETPNKTTNQSDKNAALVITPTQHQKSTNQVWLKYAALFLGLFALGITGYQLYNKTQNQQAWVRLNAHEQVSRHIQEATFFEESPIALAALELKINKKTTKPKHHIIAGAFRIKANADKKITQLHAQGYAAAGYLGINNYELHQVTYASFIDRQEALSYLRHIQATISSDAWMLSEK